MKGMEN